MVETSPLNLRAVPGSNESPDYAREVTNRIASEYVGLTKALDELLAEATKLPHEVTSDAEALMVGAHIKRLRDLDHRVESVRELEGEPYLRGKNAVDAFFFSLRDRIGKRNKTDRKAQNGAADDLQLRINDFQNRKIEIERARLEAERREQERIAREAAAKAAAEAREAEEARQKAERARTEESRARTSEAAEARERVAAQAASEARRTAELAEEARLASMARPADIGRVRGSDQSGAGVTLTVAQEPYAMLVDRNKINLEMLRPYFTDAEIEKALRGWARATGHRISMPGAEIGHRNRGVTR